MKPETALFDVIDESDAVEMLNQHDRYVFGRLVVARPGREFSDLLWYVYWGVKEARVILGEEVEGFGTLADALEYGLSPRNQERFVEAERSKT